MAKVTDELQVAAWGSARQGEESHTSSIGGAVVFISSSESSEARAALKKPVQEGVHRVFKR